MLMPSPAPSEKRIIFEHADGVFQILGVHSGELPVTLAGDGAAIQVRGQVIPFASLYKVTTRAAWYRAPHTPNAKTFHASQK
jgi:hypothetical protein